VNIDLLKEEISIEFELIEKTIEEISILKKKIGNKTPTNIEKTAAAAFLSQFYSGIENILKRVCKFYNIPLPSGINWHSELLMKFHKGESPLPIFFDNEMIDSISPYRKFRHVFFHGYGFQLDWDRMKDGLENVEIIYEKMKNSITKFLNTL